MSADVSVIVPVYDGVKFLPLAMRSLARQTLAPREVIVVDDGSRDGSAAAARALGGGLACDLVVVEKCNGGLSSAMNAGLARARGAWILELDADDYLADVAIERFASAARDGIDVVSSHFDYFWFREPAWIRRLLVRRIRWPAPSAPGFFRTNRIITTSLARRSKVEACGGWDERLTAHQDWDLWLRMWTGTNFAQVEESLVRVFRHRGSMSANAERMGRHRVMVVDNWRTRYEGVPRERL
jgi:glycosyltransferase involved in cell wall biosynthesis